jgi:protein involved in polysaccharide export with SLBB domain
MKVLRPTADVARYWLPGIVLLASFSVLCGSGGCTWISSARHAVPANRLDPLLRGCSKESVAALPYTTLGQTPVAEHLIGPGDTLAVYIYGILPANEDESPIVQRTQTVNQQYYPPSGTELGARMGLPIQVNSDGTLDLPYVGRIHVEGLTMARAVDKVLKTYTDAQLLKQGRERVTIGLVSPRVKRVVVLREDTPAEPVTMVLPGLNDQIHRGSGRVIDLPIYQNDVLHALAATGGLPGTDAKRELWILRNVAAQDLTFISPEQLQAWTNQSGVLGVNPDVIRIPLVGCPGSVLPFAPHDVILETGNVLYVPRRSEYFVSGGLLPGAKIPLPRDEDIDVLEAIALANGSIGGPLGQSGSALKNGRPGFMREPTRVLILRKLPEGHQLAIRVDLDRAMQDDKERILIQHEDVVMLQFKPSAAGLNGALNFTKFSIIPTSANNNINNLP